MAEEAVLGYLQNNDEINDSGEFAAERGIDHNEIVNVVKSLHGFRYVDAVDIKRETWVLTDEGNTYATLGSPEFQLILAIPPEGISRDELQKKLGPSVFKIACAQAAKNKWVEMGKQLISRKVQDVEDRVKNLLLQIQQGQGIGSDDIKALKARKLIVPQTWKGYSVKKGPNYAPKRKKVVTDLTRDNFQSGEWKEIEFKEYNYTAKGQPLEGGSLHPLLKVRAQIKQIFHCMGFEEMPTNNYVESSFWNFDSLFQPQQHPARDSHDTFFLEAPSTTKKLPEDYVQRVKQIHESGGYESRGYAYDWKREEANKNLLRTHTTAVSSRMLYQLAQKPFSPKKYFSIDRVFRNEAVDRTHLAEFHQIEGLVCDRGLTLCDLIGVLSLYVGDLEGSVNEGQLFDLFSQVAQVVSIRVCRDQTRRSSLGYAYVNFTNAQDAANAKELLNFTPLNEKPIRIMFSQRDPSVRKSGSGNVFIKNLDTSIDHKALHDTFAAFGPVLSCKVALDGNGQSKGYGFVQFDNEEAAKSAIKQLDGMLINDKQVYVGFFVRHQERARTNGSPKFTNVYVKNISEASTDEDLKQLFGPFGMITSATVMKDANGKSRCFGFVNFQSPDSAAAAVEKLNGTAINDDKVLFVGRAQRKAERENELKVKFEQERISRYEKLQGANLYLKNLDDDFNEEKLKDLFSEFGTVTSCRVMLDSHGHSKGSGFVAFSTPEEANKALNEMNGKLVGRKPLFVAVAQRKEERKAQLQAHFAQIRAPGGMAPLAAGLTGYHPGAPRLAPQQLYYGQGTPGFIPPQPAGFGFQQQILPGMRPGVAPNFVMPYQLQRQGQNGQRIGARRNGNLQHVQQNQMLHRNSNQGYRYMANNRNGMDSSGVHQGLAGPMLPMTFDGSGVSAAPIDNQRPGSTSLASALASATPDNQRMMLGEHLYPLVDRLTPNQHTAKVTGMLLEMDQSEVIHLIESPDALKIKVSEALQVLHEAASGSEVGDQLGSLSLNK